MKIKRLNHEENDVHEGRATKKNVMSVALSTALAFSGNASLREAFLRVLRVFVVHLRSCFCAQACEVTA